jgi:hypothetical protein
MRQRARGEIEYLPPRVTFHHPLLLHIVTERPNPLRLAKAACNIGFRILRTTGGGNRGDMAIPCGTNSPPCAAPRRLMYLCHKVPGAHWVRSPTNPEVRRRRDGVGFPLVPNFRSRPSTVTRRPDDRASDIWKQQPFERPLALTRERLLMADCRSKCLAVDARQVASLGVHRRCPPRASRRFSLPYVGGLPGHATP